jgi:hypothetical protein
LLQDEATKEDDEDDDGEEEMDVEKEEGEGRIKKKLVEALVPKEFVRQLAHIGVSSFMRTQEAHVINESNGVRSLRYLIGSRYERLGWVLGTNCIPNPVRTYSLQKPKAAATYDGFQKVYQMKSWLTVFSKPL